MVDKANLPAQGNGKGLAQHGQRPELYVLRGE